MSILDICVSVYFGEFSFEIAVTVCCLAVGSRRRHMRSCRVSVSLDERGRVYEEDEMMEDSDDIAMYEDADDDDDIFTPVKRRER
jgi:hypothetical protein